MTTGYVGLPLFDEPQVPFRGTTATSIQASQSGAVHALKSRSAKITALRQLWRQPMTMQEMATVTGWPLSSICSLKHALRHEIEAVGKDEIAWPDGDTTTRTIWQLREAKVRGEK